MDDVSPVSLALSFAQLPIGNLLSSDPMVDLLGGRGSSLSSASGGRLRSERVEVIEAFLFSHSSRIGRREIGPSALRADGSCVQSLR